MTVSEILKRLTKVGTNRRTDKGDYYGPRQVNPGSNKVMLKCKTTLSKMQNYFTIDNLLKGHCNSYNTNPILTFFLSSQKNIGLRLLVLNRACVMTKGNIFWCDVTNQQLTLRSL